MKYLYIAALGALALTGCSREDEDVTPVTTPGEYPQLILFDDEGGGELEDSDEASLVITLADRYDESAEELGGRIFPLSQDYMLDFSIVDTEGITNLADYITGAEAYYEIDDCTTSLDNGEDLVQSFDPATGAGTLLFPAGVEEIELVFILDETYFDDGDVNDFRGFNVRITGSGQEATVFSMPFEYEVLDDEVIFGEWELDATNTEQFDRFKELFGLINEDVAGLQSADVEGITIEFAYDEMAVVVELTETEEVTECGETESENLEIEIEAGYDDITRDAREGDIVLEDDVELENGAEEEFVYEGSFQIQNGVLTLTLTGEFDDEETSETTLTLTR
ncbi:hypothetical protein AB9P05_24785 [Roseivirga sp. BDSF3-8]|uniref:hypothetical protein n=1 Tax=Roseivirga sp. BDSF3-8 TaxID=3241598 RepID=UPI0035319E5C